MTHAAPRRSRRTVLRDFGRTSVGLLVIGAGLAGCDTGGDPVVASSPSGAAGPGTDLPGTAGPGTAVPGTAVPGTVDGASEPDGAGESAAEGETSRAIVDLGFVAAYVVSRGGQAALIDTGVEGSADAIEGVLGELGLGWNAVSDIIVTHAHGDHAGSLAVVSDAAAEAAIWAGAADLGSMSASREITAVGDGDQVFGMDIVETPGHTPGHISVIDGSILFTGDALVGEGGAVAGPPAQFTADMPTAIESIAKLGTVDVSQVNVFHGFPIEGTSADLTALAASLA